MPLHRELVPQPPGCSFCGRPVGQVRGIVAGDGAGICDECVALAAEILHERGILVVPEPRSGAPSRDRSARERSTGWLTSPQGIEADEVVVIDLTAELIEIDPDDTQDVRWPAVGRS